MSAANGSLVNGDSIQFEYANNEYSDEGSNHAHDQHSTSKKKKKKKKSKKNKTRSVNVIGEELDFDDPDFEYPDSRVLKQNSNGDVIVQSLEPTKKSPSISSSTATIPPKSQRPILASTSAANDDLLPKDPIELNNQLKEYWKSLSVEEKKNLLNLERDSVFKVMKDQQKITCNCSVCGRKRQIIESELKKLYDTYFEGIDTYELINSDLFDLSVDDKRAELNLSARKSKEMHLLASQNNNQNSSYQVGSSSQSTLNQKTTLPKIDSTRKNGIMSVAEDLLQNDGRKFLEMMEKLAESRIQRQSQYMKKNDLVNSDQIEEEENLDYNTNDDDYDDHDSLYDSPQPQKRNLTISDINFSYNEESDATYQQEETDTDDIESEEFWTDEEEMSKEDYLLLMEESKAIMDEDLENLTGDPEQLLNLQLKRQQQLHQQLQREKQELEQLQEEYLDQEDDDEEYDDEDDDDEYDDDDDEFEHHHSHTHSCGHDHHDHSHSHAASHGPDYHESEDKDMNEIKALLNDDGIESEDEDYEEYSDDAIDEEQQLEEGRAMLQLCTTKMLKQSLIESLKNKRREENVNALLNELDQEADRQKQKEEKKQREKEKKREKKRAIQQQKEEDRLKKEAEQERLKKEKEDENRRKVEEGRRRKQEQDRKRQEEKRLKEEQQEKARKLREEKKKLKEQDERLAQEAAKREKELAELKKREEIQRAKELAEKQEQIKQQQALQQQIALEESQRKEHQEALRIQSQQQPTPSGFEDVSSRQNSIGQYNIQPSVNPLLDNIFQNSPFLSSPLTKSLQPQNQQQTTTFGLENSLGQFKPQTQFNSTVPQAQNSFFSTRTDNVFNSSSVSSPWSNNQTPLTSTLYNPLFDKNSENFPTHSRQSYSSIQSNIPDVNQRSGSATPLDLSVTTQNGFSNNGTNDIDFLTSKLSSTSFDDFNGSNMLSGSGVWSSQPVRSRSHSEWPNISTSSNVWGGSPAPTQASIAPHSTMQNTSSNNLGGYAPVQPISMVNESKVDVNLLLGTYQKQIYDTYTFAQAAHLSNGWMDIKELHNAFNSIQPEGQLVDLLLFNSLLQSPNNLYSAAFAKDETRNITHVKLTSIVPGLNHGLNNSARNGSAFQLAPSNNGGMSDVPGYNDRLLSGGLSDNLTQNLNGGGLTWGSIL